jgi:CheY-like chemotaxis protein
MSTILVVDDDRNILSAFKNLLEGQGHQVQTAAHGQAALAMIEQQAPDLLVMDIRMPGMSGLEAFERIKAVAP